MFGLEVLMGRDVCKCKHEVEHLVRAVRLLTSEVHRMAGELELLKNQVTLNIAEEGQAHDKILALLAAADPATLIDLQQRLEVSRLALDAVVNPPPPPVG